MHQIRRIVTGANAEGLSCVVLDGPPQNTALDRVAELWVTDRTPASNEDVGDASLGPIGMNPAAGGSIFRYIELPPEAEMGDAKAEREVLSSVAVDTTRHPMMHKTSSIDYVVLLSGAITLILEDGEVDVKPFDVVVQRGVNHAWVNRGSEPAMLLAVMIDADPV